MCSHLRNGKTNNPWRRNAIIQMLIRGMIGRQCGVGAGNSKLKQWEALGCLLSSSVATLGEGTNQVTAVTLDQPSPLSLSLLLLVCFFSVVSSFKCPGSFPSSVSEHRTRRDQKVADDP